MFVRKKDLKVNVFKLESWNPTFSNTYNNNWCNIQCFPQTFDISCPNWNITVQNYIYSIWIWKCCRGKQNILFSLNRSRCAFTMTWSMKPWPSTGTGCFRTEILGWTASQCLASVPYFRARCLPTSRLKFTYIKRNIPTFISINSYWKIQKINCPYLYFIIGVNATILNSKFENIINCLSCLWL